MSYTTVAILSLSIVFAAIIAAIRFERIDKKYLPFIVLIWLALANETTSFILIRMGYSNAVNANIFSLMESILIILFFKRLGLFDNRLKIFTFFLCLFITAWIIEKFYISSLNRFSSYFVILYSFTVVLMSIHMINRLLAAGSNQLWRNAVFLVCLGFILFFTYTLLVEIFWIYGLNKSKQFRINVYRIMTFINLFVNLVYAVAVLWIPPKQRSILQ